MKCTYFSSLVFIFLIVGCQKNIEVDNINAAVYDKNILDEIEVVGDMLKFSEGELGSLQVRILNLMPFQEYVDFINSKSFVSFELKLNDILKELESIDDTKLAEDFIINNPKFLELNDGVSSPRITAYGYSRIVNEDGFYLAGNRLSRFTNDHVLILADSLLNNNDDVESLKRLLDTSVEPLYDFVTIKKVSDFNSPINFRDCSLVKDQSIEYNRRKVVQAGYLENIVVGDYVDKVAVLVVKGEKKKPIGKDWIRYSTILEIRDWSFQVTNSFGNDVTFNDLSSHSGTVELLELVGYQYLQATPCNYTTTYCDWTLHYHWFKGRSKSRGTNNHWAVGCCSTTSCPPDYGM